jgi:hypothetical protein
MTSRAGIAGFEFELPVAPVLRRLGVCRNNLRFVDRDAVAHALHHISIPDTAPQQIIGGDAVMLADEIVQGVVYRGFDTEIADDCM